MFVARSIEPLLCTWSVRGYLCPSPHSYFLYSRWGTAALPIDYRDLIFLPREILLNAPLPLFFVPPYDTWRGKRNRKQWRKSWRERKRESNSLCRLEFSLNFCLILDIGNSIFLFFSNRKFLIRKLSDT